GPAAAGGRGFGGPVVLEAQGPHAPSIVQQESTKLKGCFPCMLIFFTNLIIPLTLKMWDSIAF
ncbi:unnamed protein product, partial [Callosobruchus maculatus]